MMRRVFVIFLVCSVGGRGGAAPLPVPEEVADDYTFLRRVTLDITGRLPTPDEIRAFVRSKDRDRKVEELLASPQAGLYHADLWMQWLLDHDVENGDFYRMNVGELHAWLMESFDRPWSGMVRALVVREGPAGNFARKHLQGREPPVKLALVTSRLLMGRDIRCAQCHDHPSERLTHEEFWGFVSIFGRGSGGIKDHLGEVRAKPRFLDGREPGEKPLESLAEFIDWRPAIAERYWKLLMGQKKHPAELEKARSPRDLVRAIAARPEYRARKGPLKYMNSVQFMNAFGYIFDLEEAHRKMLKLAVEDKTVLYIFKNEQVMRLHFHKWAKEMILPKGQNPEDVRAKGTVRLSLKLMNNQKVQRYIAAGWGKLRTVLSRKHRESERVEELFLTVVGRPPTLEERQIFRARIFTDYEDIFWALVNSAEFIFVS